MSVSKRLRFDIFKRDSFTRKLDEIQSMNSLQDAAIVSNNCVGDGDVAEADCTAAIAFLTFGRIKPRFQTPVQNEMAFQQHNDP